jgi:hypothetical protein
MQSATINSDSQCMSPWNLLWLVALHEHSDMHSQALCDRIATAFGHCCAQWVM